MPKSATKSATKPGPVAPAATKAEQTVATGLLWLGAAFAAGVTVLGAWVFRSGFPPEQMLPTRVGLGFMMMYLGVLGCWAGFYIAAHSKLIGGKLAFDAQARDLITSPFFVRFLKVIAHTTGIIVLAVSWMAAYYPQGVAMH